MKVEFRLTGGGERGHLISNPDEPKELWVAPFATGIELLRQDEGEGDVGLLLEVKVMPGPHPHRPCFSSSITNSSSGGYHVSGSLRAKRWLWILGLPLLPYGGGGP